MQSLILVFNDTDLPVSILMAEVSSYLWDDVPDECTGIVNMEDVAYNEVTKSLDRHTSRRFLVVFSG